MYGSQEKILGQKVNVKFFTVDPYSVGMGVSRNLLELGKILKNICLKIKTSTIKSAKNIYQTIHSINSGKGKQWGQILYFGPDLLAYLEKQYVGAQLAQKFQRCFWRDILYTMHAAL